MSVGLLKKNIYDYSERVLKYSTLRLRISVRKHLRKNYIPVYITQALWDCGGGGNTSQLLLLGSPDMVKTKKNIPRKKSNPRKTKKVVTKFIVNTLRTDFYLVNDPGTTFHILGRK